MFSVQKSSCICTITPSNNSGGCSTNEIIWRSLNENWVEVSKVRLLAARVLHFNFAVTHPFYTKVLHLHIIAEVDFPNEEQLERKSVYGSRGFIARISYQQI